MSGPFPGIAARRKDVGFLSEPASSLTRRSWDYDDVRPFARQLSCTRGPGAGDQSLQPHSRFESEGWRFSSEELTLPDGEWRDAYSSVTIVPHRGEAAISETEGRDLRWPGNCFAYRRTWITEAVRAKSQEAEECTGQDRYPGMATELREAMRELDDAEEDAREDGFPIPSTVAIRNSRRILRELYEFSPQYFAVYPEPDGGYSDPCTESQGVFSDPHSRIGRRSVVSGSYEGEEPTGAVRRDRETAGRVRPGGLGGTRLDSASGLMNVGKEVQCADGAGRRRTREITQGERVGEGRPVARFSNGVGYGVFRPTGLTVPQSRS